MPHTVSPLGQLSTQWPPEHMKPAEQTLPQVPQLAGSFCVLEHWPEQFVSPLGQLITQLPWRHTLPAGQTCPHAPQFWLSVITARHWVPQRI